MIEKPGCYDKPKFTSSRPPLFDRLETALQEAVCLVGESQQGLWILDKRGEYFQPDGMDAENTIEIVHDVQITTSYLRVLHYTLMLHGY